ncbi:hypothetical protein GmHk_01G000964 [Glycine max]|nr:hypothetical protein GmHk_01G000964 [Glycine max]
MQGVLVEALIQLHLTPMISRLLVGHMLHICVHLELHPLQVSREGLQRWWLPAAVEVAAMHLQLAGPPPAATVPNPIDVPTLACNIFL